MSLKVDDATRQRLLKYVVMPSERLPNAFGNISRAEDENSCWQWTGGMSLKSPKWLPYKSGLSCNAAKAVYQLFKGEIPEGKKVTRICGNSRCVSPHHALTDLERFWSKVDKTSDPNGCWLWLDHIKATGYGEFRDGKKKVVAHRFAYEITKGKIPEGLVVMHKCDRRACVNPDHLMVGTQADNIHDMMQKGRANFPTPPCNIGSKCGSAKLTEEQVAEIKQLLAKGFTYKAIMNSYKVSKNTIYNIKAGLYWKHVK